MPETNQAENGPAQSKPKLSWRPRLRRIGRIALIVLIALAIIGVLVVGSGYFKMPRIA